jgi:rhodanese-related sulfurtransferase
MNSRWIVGGALVLSLLCSCRSSNGPERQTSQQEPPATGAAEQIREISTSQLKDWITAGQPFTLIDVREDDEWQAGHAASAIHISRWTLVKRIGAAVPDKAARVVLYCRSGKRSAMAAGVLQRMGYTSVFSLAGGFKDYQLVGLPVQH